MTYPDPFQALDEMRRLNRECGSDDYTVCASPDGFVVRRITTWGVAYLKWRRSFYRQIFGGPNTDIKDTQVMP